MGQGGDGCGRPFPLPPQAGRFVVPGKGVFLPDVIQIFHARVVNHADGQFQVTVSDLTFRVFQGHQ